MPVEERDKEYIKLFHWMGKFGIYYMTYGSYTSLTVSRCKNKFVYGYFEDSRWFNDIKDILCDEYQPKIFNKNNEELMKYILTNESVCISLRHWTGNAADRNICNKQYYIDAIREIKCRINCPTFIVFSDDIAWAKKQMEDIEKEVPIIYESGKDDVAEKLNLMRSCKHFIITNSTFCWWAQYLSNYKNKIVIAPERWFWNRPDHLMEKYFIRIPYVDD